MLHSLLSKQLEDLRIDQNLAPEGEVWRRLIETIDRAYRESDNERLSLEHSLIVSSEEMKSVCEKLCASENRYALAAAGANDGLWDWDLIGEDYFYSDRWLEIVGIEIEKDKKFSRLTWLNRIHPEDRVMVEKSLDDHLVGEINYFRSEHRVLSTDGKYRWILVRGLAVRDEEGKTIRIAGSLTDISDRKLAEERLEHDAFHDVLTGLPNRKLLFEKLTALLSENRKSANHSFAVMFIDIDRFKSINDSLGHQAGDEVLLRIAEVLRKATRGDDLVARMGGDEFVVVFDDISTREQARQIAERLLFHLKRPIRVKGRHIYSSASIGIAFGSEDYKDPDALIGDADIAMYHAKTNGRSRTEFFDPKLRESAEASIEMEADLRRAIDQNEFVLHYQPIVSLAEGSIIGFESLVRWMHPVKGLLPPNDFISVAEKTGLILPLGYWVLRESCFQVRDWQEKYPLSNLLTISVNLSARQLDECGLALQVKDILRESRLNPNCLRIEITESVIMGNAEQAIETVKELRELGVRVSIDDFGTGYSSLGYLHQFPVDTLKVDRSFINRIGMEGENSAIVETIIGLAKNLNMDVIAEGVETEEQKRFLQEINCKYGQGFLYSRPLDIAAAAEILRELVRKEYSHTGIIASIHDSLLPA